MATFSRTELKIVEALADGAHGKKLLDATNLKEDTLAEWLAVLKNKLGANSQSEIPERFVAVTGWSSPATKYPN